MSEPTQCPTCDRRIYHQVGRRHYAQCWRCRRTQPLPRVCAVCGVSIAHRSAQSQYCAPCATEKNKARDRQQRRERYAAEQRRKLGKPALDDVWAAAAEARCAPRDLDLEAKIDAHLAHIRASRQYTITADIVWARRVDPVAAEAQDLAGASLCLTVETRTQRERRGQRLAAAERRAIAAEQGAA